MNKLNGINVAALDQFSQSVARDPSLGLVSFRVKTRWTGQTSSIATVDSFSLGGKPHAREFTIAADEPPQLLGNNTAPNPQELLLAGLNACMTVGYAANAAVMRIKLENLEIKSEGELDLRGFLGLDPTVKPGYDEVRYTVTIRTTSPIEQVQALHNRVTATSPNFFNFSNPITLKPELKIEVPVPTH